jgi:uncharacterized membrane protein YgcG
MTIMGTVCKEFLIALMGLCLFLGIPAAHSADPVPGDLADAVQDAKAAGLSEAALNRILAAGVERRVPSDEFAKIFRAVAQSGREGLPLEPLAGKVEEGLAKGVEAPLVLKAVQQESNRLRFISGLIRQTAGAPGTSLPRTQNEEVVRAARTLSMGVTEQEMQRIFQIAPHASLGERANSLEFLAVIKQAGMGGEWAMETVRTGLEKGFFSKAAWELAKTIRAARNREVPIERIKAEARGVVEGAKGLGEARKSLGLHSGDFLGGPQTLPVPDRGVPDRGLDSGRPDPGFGRTGGGDAGPRGGGTVPGGSMPGGAGSGGGGRGRR